MRNQVAAVERSRDMWRERVRAKEAQTCSAEATQSIAESQSQEVPERSEQRGHEFAPLSAPLTAPHGTGALTGPEKGVSEPVEDAVGQPGHLR